MTTALTLLSFLFPLAVLCIVVASVTLLVGTLIELASEDPLAGRHGDHDLSYIDQPTHRLLEFCNHEDVSPAADAHRGSQALRQ